MSDHSIADIARGLAAALIASPNERERAEAKSLPHDQRDHELIAKLEQELCAAYHAELIETLRV
jgi:hypothetical protein